MPPADKYFLTDFVGNEDDVLNLQSQNSYYIEPGVKYQFENKVWNPKLLGSLSHVGFSNRYSRYFQNLPTLDLGGSVAPEAFGKRVFLALSSRWKKNSAKKYKWTWRAGSLVNYGILTASLRLGREDFAAGFYSQFWSSQVGLVYEEFVLGDEGEEKTRVQSLLSQISFVF